MLWLYWFHGSMNLWCTLFHGSWKHLHIVVLIFNSLMMNLWFHGSKLVLRMIHWLQWSSESMFLQFCGCIPLFIDSTCFILKRFHKLCFSGSKFRSSMALRFHLFKYERQFFIVSGFMLPLYNCFADLLLNCFDNSILIKTAQCTYCTLYVYG